MKLLLAIACLLTNSCVVAHRDWIAAVWIDAERLEWESKDGGARLAVDKLDGTRGPNGVISGAVALEGIKRTTSTANTMTRVLSR